MIHDTPDDDIAELLRQSIGRFVRTVRARADTLPPPQAAALGVLDRDGPQTIARLAADRRITHQSMSRTVAELEKRGFVARRPNPADRRAVLIVPTPAGTEALAADRDSRRRWVAAAIEEKLTAEERAILHAVPAVLDRLSEVDSPVT
ncbi:MarR family transcriptional regulator [Actinoplanes sp. NPDC023714]|uniref:MarR family winged helix-turn-helix transcriptional regulator n=1 Tax=Actinoplanes sp. NPDC023714 TaxID=3154322 RepID=UPI0033D53BCB